MPAFIDLTTQKFGRLTVMSRGPNNKRNLIYWWCQCTCGEIVLACAGDLNRGRIKSCGCLQREKSAERMRVYHKEVGFGGNKNPAWKGGVTPKHILIRNSDIYLQWRTQVFERDDYTCQKCGMIGGKLNAHHVESFHNNPEFRTAVGNGITFCENCHKDFHHQYGNTCSVKQVRLFILG